MSESEEMYLVTIARLKENGEGQPIPLSQIAGELNVAPVSANQMVRKLEESGWVCYTPYKGVDLTAEGQRIALQILRHRRLWEVFLIENLKIPASEAADIACRMEHFLPPAAADRLADFLGNPSVTPQGQPIPTSQSDVPYSDLPLTALSIDEMAEITRLNEDPAVRAFLIAENLLPGTIVRLTAIAGDGSVLLQSSDGRNVHLSGKLAEGLWVTRKQEAHKEAVR